MKENTNLIRRCNLGVTLAILIVSLFACFVAPRLYAENSDSGLERIKYYQLALQSQQRALSVCVDKIDQLGASDTINGKKQKYNRAYFVKLHSVYMVKIINTMKYLASEHEAVAKKNLEQREYTEALVHMAHVAKIWEKIGETYERRGFASMNGERFTEAGSFYEQAYSAYKKAQAKWKDNLTISSKWNNEELKKNDKIVKIEIKDNFFDGVEALKTSASAFLQSYNQLRRKAQVNRQRRNIHRKNMGQEWVEAARASANYERVNARLKNLQENMWESFSL